ncbi:MAG: hypothetical protein GVY17_05935 [Cyanobacteria bacterium]|jgi:hypothetical protein|nr:hypothetical protein [Cyanobacteria bacterium GSL.Bin21]
MCEMTLIIDVLHCWHQERISREQSLEVLSIIGKSTRGRRTIEQLRELLREALEAT